MVFCSFPASFLPRFDFDEDGVSDFRFVPAADGGDELFRDGGLELCPASLAEDLVPAMSRSVLP